MIKHKGCINKKRSDGGNFSYNPIHINGGVYLFADEVANIIDKNKDYVINRSKLLRKVEINPFQVAIPFDDVIAYLRRYGKEDRANYLLKLHNKLIEKGAYEKK